MGVQANSLALSLSQLGVLDVVPAVSALNDGVDPNVELGEVCNSLLDTLGSGGVGVFKVNPLLKLETCSGSVIPSSSPQNEICKAVYFGD